MGDPRGFIKHKRIVPTSRQPEERIHDYREIYEAIPAETTRAQASRCMDCGVPFCQSGCPLGNVIPEFNDAVYQGNWKGAYEILSQTNNFPEITGRICPAPCEQKCVLNINQLPVTIEHIEKSIAEHAFENNYVQPQHPATRSGKKVAVIGSGPAGLAAASQLNKAGHLVTVFEKNTRIGGLLRYGIPDFKLEKNVLDRRLAVMEAEGISFRANAEVGDNIAADDVLNEYNAVILCGGSGIPRALNIPGKDLQGVHFAMEFLEQNNKRVAGDAISADDEIFAAGKNVVVIGGGDTGSDCVGTSNRHGAKSVMQLELLSQPPKDRPADLPWTAAPMLLKTTSSHEEGCERHWAILTKSFIGDAHGNLKGLQLVNVEWKVNPESGRSEFMEIEGTEREVPCELAFLAIGYLHPQFEGLLQQLGIAINDRGNVADANYQTNIDKVFVAGDMRRGQSLVVWAIAEGRAAASAVNQYLK